MIAPRLIPCLLLHGSGFVKTVRFASPRYIGDPINTVKLFNDKAVDELAILDIRATPAQTGIRYEILKDIVSEAFVPVTYGGGVKAVDDFERLFAMGVEKVAVNTAGFYNPKLLSEAALRFGSQSVVAAIDVKKRALRGWETYVKGGNIGSSLSPTDHARRAVDCGAGEILLNSVDRDGTMSGYDLELIRKVVGSVRVPVIACGGAASVTDLVSAITGAGAAGAAAGSLFVYHGPHRAVLINAPDPSLVDQILAASRTQRP